MLSHTATPSRMMTAGMESGPFKICQANPPQPQDRDIYQDGGRASCLYVVTRAELTCLSQQVRSATQQHDVCHTSRTFCSRFPRRDMDRQEYRGAPWTLAQKGGVPPSRSLKTIADMRHVQNDISSMLQELLRCSN